jgi:hypothetical protein
MHEYRYQTQTSTTTSAPITAVTTVGVVVALAWWAVPSDGCCSGSRRSSHVVPGPVPVHPVPIVQPPPPPYVPSAPPPCATNPSLPGCGSATAACADGIDNDGDGAIDYPSDRGCSGRSDGQE